MTFIENAALGQGRTDYILKVIQRIVWILDFFWKDFSFQAAWLDFKYPLDIPLDARGHSFSAFLVYM